MKIPDWWEALILALAAWRSFQLLAYDDIMDPVHRYVTRRGRGWKKEGDPLPKEYREKLAAFLSCPYCFGFWIALAWWGVWQMWPHGTLVVGVPFMLSAALVGAHKLLTSE